MGEKVRKFYSAATKWKTIGDEPLAKLKLYYHTPDMFDFLQEFKTRIAKQSTKPLTATNSTRQSSSVVQASAVAWQPRPPTVPSSATSNVTAPTVKTKAPCVSPGSARSSPEWESWVAQAMEGAASDVDILNAGSSRSSSSSSNSSSISNSGVPALTCGNTTKTPITKKRSNIDLYEQA